MSQARDYTLAAVIGGGSFLIAALWPHLAPLAGLEGEVEPVATGEQPDAEPDSEAEAPADASTEPTPETPPETVPEDETEPVPTIAVDVNGLPPVYGAAGGLQDSDMRAATLGEPLNTGSGATSQLIYAPGLVFPLADAAAYANSQVYRNGGYLGSPPWDQCAAANYDYPWADNYCETRGGQSNAFCPVGSGHRGQDIRPASCTRDSGTEHTAVAVTDGTIVYVGSYSVRLENASGRQYHYLHLRHYNDSCDLAAIASASECAAADLAALCGGSALAVSQGDVVSAGDPIGQVARNWFGITWDGASNQCVERQTTTHLHFEVRATLAPSDGAEPIFTPAPPFTSLVPAYDTLIAEAGHTIPAPVEPGE